MADFHCPAGVEASCNVNGALDYDLGLHIAAFFVLLVGSAIGVFVPITLGIRSTKTIGWIAQVVFILKHFGTGIILSTAFSA
jgi:zinc transporter 1/2/3